MRKYSLLQKFSLICLAALVVFGIAFGWVITVYLENSYLEMSKKWLAETVSGQAKFHFKGSVFSGTKTGPEYEDIAERIRDMNLGEDIKRIKIWNLEKIIVWSDDANIVGNAFPDDRELATALGGEVSSTLSGLKKIENRSETRYGRLLELYVPIKSRPDGPVEYVIEVYQDLHPLRKEIGNNKAVLWAATCLGFGSLYLLLFGIMLGASRRLKAQTETIRFSEERHRNLLRSAPDGIVSIDRHGNIVIANEAAATMFGYTPEQMSGKPVTILMPEHMREKHQAATDNFFKTGNFAFHGKISELEGLRRDGHPIPLDLSLSTTGEGENLLITGILRDITDRKIAQERLILSEKAAAVSVIAGSIGHEMNNSIMGLQGYSLLAMSKPEDRDLSRKLAEVVSIHVQRMKLHSNNLLSLSKPREPAMKSVCLNGLLERVTDMLFVSGLLKLYTIEKTFAEEPSTIWADEMQIEQVIRNLEINAAHAMGRGGILTLKTKPSSRTGYVEFSISDTGHGIPESLRNQIFLPFFTTKEKGKGTGLGMHIVQQIVTLHKGFIHLESEEGSGTTITVELPAAAPGEIPAAITGMALNYSLRD